MVTAITAMMLTAIARWYVRYRRREMNSQYLIIDRSGNAVDINQPTCHDHYRTCHGCPDRVAEPRCHTTCDGYKTRRAETERRNAEQRLIGSAYIPDGEFSKRLRDIQAAKDRKNRR